MSETKPEETGAPAPVTAPPTAPIATPVVAPVPAATPIVAAPAAPAAVVPAVELDDADRQLGISATATGVSVPEGAFKKIKERALARGRAEVESKLAARAAALGFDTIDELFTALEQQEEHPVTTPAAPTNQPAPAAPAAAAITPAPAPAAAAIPPAAQPVAAVPPAGAELENDRRLPEEMRKKLRMAREDMRKQTEAAQAQAQQANTALEARNAEMTQWQAQQSMREDLIRSGVTDLEFTWHSLREHIKTLDEAALKTFDLAAWTAEFKKARPWLFGQQNVPANTGLTPGPTTPTPPGAAAVAGAAGNGSVVDHRNTDKKTFKADMEKRGIRIP